MKDSDIHQVVKILRREKEKWNVPVVTLMSQTERNPFKILIATLLSLRTKDEVTAKAAERLFQVAETPEEMLKLEEEEIASLIYPVGFYRRKAKNIREVCRILIEKYGGKVPDELEELLKLPGVGRKTANLVVTLGFGKPGICVDTHVHRISNRLGYVRTRTPEETEFALREKLPKEYWIEFNDLLVSLGQQICHPTSPRCSNCPVEKFCDKVGVERSR
ncbi:MAG: endonuclease III [Desulfurobacteriaceae bacterium]